jgi:hypothetical protein
MQSTEDVTIRTIKRVSLAISANDINVFCGSIARLVLKLPISLKGVVS